MLHPSNTPATSLHAVGYAAHRFAECWHETARSSGVQAGPQPDSAAAACESARSASEAVPAAARVTAFNRGRTQVSHTSALDASTRQFARCVISWQAGRWSSTRHRAVARQVFCGDWHAFGGVFPP